MDGNGNGLIKIRLDPVEKMGYAPSLKQVIIERNYLFVVDLEQNHQIYLISERMNGHQLSHFMRLIMQEFVIIIGHKVFMSAADHRTNGNCNYMIYGRINGMNYQRHG